MLKIGDFSRLANVTVKALRHYDELGLLKPAWIDRFSGYRYYTLEQLPRLNRILALKDLGLSLEQVQRVLDSTLSAGELRGMLHLKQAELQQKLIEEQMRLARVAARLKQIEQEDRPSIDAVVVRPVEAQLVAYAQAVAPTRSRLPEERAAARRDVESWLEKLSLHPPGPWLVVYTNTEYVERDIKLEVGIVLEDLPQGDVPSPWRVMVRQLPALPQAAIYHHTGPQETLPQAYAALYGWVEANGYRVSGLAREIYWRDEQPPSADPHGAFDWDLERQPAPAQPVTAIEVQLPVEPILLVGAGKDTPLQPEIIESSEILVAGLLYEGTNDNYEVAELWAKEFMPCIDRIRRAEPYLTYGVCEMSQRVSGGLRYTAAVPIARPEDAPPDFYQTRIPAGKYAVFKHIGALEGLHKTYEYIYQAWLPQSGYKRDSRPDVEVYTHQFHAFQSDSVLHIWVPIE